MSGKRTELFFVSIWEEHADGGDGPGVWRGRVEDAHSHAKKLFRDASQLSEFLAEHSNSTGLFDDLSTSHTMLAPNDIGPSPFRGVPLRPKPAQPAANPSKRKPEK